MAESNQTPEVLAASLDSGFLRPQHAQLLRDASDSMEKRSLQTRISNVFILQAAAIACATLLGIYASAAVLEDLLIKRALQDEAQHYTKVLVANPAAPEPNTYNMQGYLLPRPGLERTVRALPPELGKLGPGYHNLRISSDFRPLVYVKDIPQGRLTLVFDQQNVGKLALLFGLVPLVVVLAVIYLVSLVAYRFSKQAISPIVWLANEVKRWDPRQFAEPRVDLLEQRFEGETQILAEALSNYSARIGELVERERTFTRDASHELRSPLTVIKLASEVLLEDGNLDSFAERNVRRIDAASRDMEALIEAFMLLARDSASGLSEEELTINRIIEEEIESAEPLLLQKEVQIEFSAEHQLRMVGPPKVIGVMIGNLLRNACRYTDRGLVKVHITGKAVEIVDSGRGISEQDLKNIFQPFFRGQGAPRGGHGVGLTIVRRLSERFGWPVSLESELGKGTTARIEFPKAEIVAEALDLSGAPHP